MNNDLPPSWIFEEVVTINCEFSLFGLRIVKLSYEVSSDMEVTRVYYGCFRAIKQGCNKAATRLLQPWK